MFGLTEKELEILKIKMFKALWKIERFK